jgi:hypothetical protein
MDQKIQSALKEAILQSLPTLSKLAVQCIAPYQVLRKKDNGWRGEYQQKTDHIRVFLNARNYLNVIGADFTKIFFENHPEYKGTIHCSGLGVTPYFNDTTYIFRALIQRLWERYETFDCDEAAVNSIVEEFRQFVNQPTIRYRFQAQLLNFNMSEAYLTLPNNLIVRRLNEKELSVIHFGSITRPGSNLSLTEFIHEFVLEREDKIPVIFGDGLDDIIDHPVKKIRALFDDTILALRIFKEGMIGYSFIHCKPLDFCPFLMPEIRSPGEYIPFGIYELLDDKVTQVSDHINLVSSVSEPSMKMALRRLADAEIRPRPQDKIMDAVVGMEALLLAGLGKEDRRGELKYRFSIHFSTLFNSPQERHNAFRVAKDLYDLRSTIAHGSSLTKDKIRIGNEKHLNLVEASKRATANLRIVIQYFLPKIGSDTYKNHEFWEQAYFNFGSISSNP